MCIICNGEKKIIQQLSYGAMFTPCPNCTKPKKEDLEDLILELDNWIAYWKKARKETA